MGVLRPIFSGSAKFQMRAKPCKMQEVIFEMEQMFALQFLGADAHTNRQRKLLFTYDRHGGNRLDFTSAGSIAARAFVSSTRTERRVSYCQGQRAFVI